MQESTPSIKTFNTLVPQSVENVVLKATAKDPLQRYQTIEEMQHDLETVLNPERENEEPFVVPFEDGEETKAIPAIKDDQASPVNSTSHDETKVMSTTEPEKKPKKKKWIAIILTSVAVLLAAVVITLFFLPKWLAPEDVVIPEVSEQRYDEALKQLTELGLEVERESIYSDEIEEDYVIRSTPSGGSTVKEGSSVTLYTSMGKEQIEFDDYVGKSFEQTKRYLESHGYQEVIAYHEESELPEGEITAQVQPEPGEKVIPEDTKVIFNVSSGPPTVALSSLSGWTLEEVEQYIKDQELTLTTEEEHSETVPEGQVTRQEPGANTELEKGDEVKSFHF